MDLQLLSLLDDIIHRFHGEGKLKVREGVHFTGKFEKGRAVEVNKFHVNESFFLPLVNCSN